MAAFTFTADSGTDQLTIVGHGLQTGNGAGQASNSGGGLPGGLAAVTDYWIIKVDDDHVKLAVSAAAAVVGTAINITSNGTGTQTLTIGLPNARERTYTAGSQVWSADLNAVQDRIVSAGRRTFSRTFMPVFTYQQTGIGLFVGVLSTAGTQPVQKTNGQANGMFYIPFDDGDTIDGLSFEAYGDGAVDSTGIIVTWRPSVNVSGSNLGSISSITNVPATWTPYAVPSFTSRLLAAGNLLYCFMQINAANFELGPVTATYHR